MQQNQRKVGEGTPFAASLIAMTNDEGRVSAFVKFNDDHFNRERGKMPWYAPTEENTSEETAFVRAELLWQHLRDLMVATLERIEIRQPSTPATP